MPNITDVFSSLHDAVAGLLKPPADIALQMSWPGISLSASDFKRQSNPAGPYDPQVAEETVSQIADMIPLAVDLKYENSGFEVHNVYEALLFGATFKPGPDGTPANPLAKLFLDAQFEYVRAERGSIQDPQAFYYPARATPVDWYSEASPNWTSFSLGQPQIKPATPSSPFVKLGGAQLLNQGVLRVNPASATAAQVRTELQGAVAAKITASKLALGPMVKGRVVTRGAEAPGAAAAVAAAPAISIRSQILAQTGGTLTDAVKVKTALTNLSMQASFKKSVQPTAVLAAGKLPEAAQIDAKKMMISPAVRLSLAYRANLDQLLVRTLPVATIQGTTENWSIQFRYCVVHLNRNWLNNTLLGLPNWYFPGVKAGFFSSGGTAQFPLLPQAFLAIRDLRISAKWSEQDRKTMAQAASFGPFDLRSKVIQQNEVRADGLQIIAWISRRNPALPPMNDPAVT